MTLRGERKRFRDANERLRSHVDALADCVAQQLPTSAMRQAVTSAAVLVSNHAAAIDALTHRKAGLDSLTARIETYLTGPRSEYLDQSDGCDLLAEAAIELAHLAAKVQQFTRDEHKGIDETKDGN